MSSVEFKSKLANGEEVYVIAEVGESVEVESVYPTGMDDPEDILGNITPDDLTNLETEAVERWRDRESECLDYDKLGGVA
jgi:hypothetical protein